MLLNQSNRRVGLILLPEFTYKRGQLYLQEVATLQLLSGASLNIDRTFSLCFESRKDARDSRPLVYRGRVACGISTDEKEWIWRHASVVKEGRTQPAEQLASSSMVRIEDPDPTALPTTTDYDGLVSGARKYEQIGLSAFSKLLDSCLDNVTLQGKTGVIICDLNLGVGDSFNAWLQKRGSLTVPSAFFGLTDEGVNYEWFVQAKKEEVTRQHLDGSLIIPGCQRVPLELPKEHVNEPPLAPKLKVLVASGPDGLYPKFGDAMVKELVIVSC